MHSLLNRNIYSISQFLFIVTACFISAVNTSNAQAAAISVTNSGWVDDGPAVRLKSSNDQVGIGTNNPQSKLEVNGGVRLNTIDPKPVCDNQTRGTVWVEQGTDEDQVSICKNHKTFVQLKQATLPTDMEGLSCAEDSSSNIIYCFGGFGSVGTTDDIIAYDPANDLVTVKNASLPTFRTNLSCAENSATHKIYCFGGVDFGAGSTSQITEYNPATDTLTVKSATLPAARSGLSCTEYPTTHKIYCFGGFGPSYSDQILEYNPATDSIAVKSATLPSPRDAIACAFMPLLNNIQCFGGAGPLNTYFSEIVSYSPGSDSISIRNESLPLPSASMSCVSHATDSKVYCLGGYGNGDQLDDILLLGVSGGNGLTTVASLPRRITHFSCARNSSTNKIYCFGGNGDGQGYTDFDEIVEFSANGISEIQWVPIE